MEGKLRIPFSLQGLPRRPGDKVQPMPRLSAVDPGENNILVHVPFIFFIHSSVNGRLGCFHSLTIVTSAGDLRPEKGAAWVAKGGHSSSAPSPVPCLPGLLPQPEMGAGTPHCPLSRACCLQQLMTRCEDTPKGRLAVCSRHRRQGLVSAQPGTERSLGACRVNASAARGLLAQLF